MMTHPYELDLIRKLHAFRNPLLDQFFILCNYIDTIYFTGILLAIVWLFINRKIAIKMFIVFLLSWMLNKSLKYAFGLPRPVHLDPKVGILNSMTPGFPSGAAQTAALLCGIIIVEWKSKWRWLIGPLFALVLTFSRIYLGLHFPTDILGGLLVGVGLFCTYLQLNKIPQLMT